MISAFFDVFPKALALLAFFGSWAWSSRWLERQERDRRQSMFAGIRRPGDGA